MIVARLDSCGRPRNVGFWGNWADDGGRFLSVFKRIYRHFNLLIDICFWIQVYVFTKTLLQELDVLPTPLYPDNRIGAILLMIQKILAYSTFLLLPVLFLVRRFRDEYAELLWQKTAATFARFLLFFPWLWLLGWTIAKAVFGGEEWMFGLQIPSLISLPDYPVPADQISPGLRQLLLLDGALAFVWFFGPLVFVSIYKWHRCRTER